MSIFTLPWFVRPCRGPRQPYTGEQLRAIRKKNGVGRPPRLYRDYEPDMLDKKWSWLWQVKQVNAMAAKVDSVRNYLEWLSKPRKRNAVTPKRL